jgi:hypothetical protein
MNLMNLMRRVMMRRDTKENRDFIVLFRMFEDRLKELNK